MKNNKLSLVIPTLNEKGNIRDLVKEIDKHITIPYEIIFIDDHSTDSTVSEIKKLIKKYPIRLALKKGKRGKTFSLLEGFAKAKYNLLGMIDADLQYPPSAIPKMLTLLESPYTDIVIANRIDYKAPLKRRVVSGISRIAINILWNLNVDTQAGLKIFKKEVLENVVITTKNEWTFDIDFLVRAKERGYTIKIIDIIFHPRKNGVSKIDYSLSGAWKLIKEAYILKMKK